VACGVLGHRADVDHDQISIVQTAGDLLTVDLLERAAVAEVRGGEVADDVMVTRISPPVPAGRADTRAVTHRYTGPGYILTSIIP